jgi:hypothetical protein
MTPRGEVGPRSKLCALGVKKVSPGGEDPLFAPPFFLRTYKIVNERVNFPFSIQSSPLGAKFIPGGSSSPLGVNSCC